MFEDFLRFCYAYVHSLKSPELSSNHYGLVKEIHPIRFLHHSLPFFLAAMCTMTTRMYDSYSMQRSDLNSLYNLFLLSLKADPKSALNHRGMPPPNMYEIFETQLPNKDCQHPSTEYRIFDPLYWYIYGWCLNNNPNQELHIPPHDMPAQYRQLAIKRIHQSLKHPKLCDQNIITISIRGNIEMWKYIETIVDTKQCGFVPELCISNITESCFNDHRLNDLFPCLQSLRIECSNWSSFFDSLSELQFLENLITINPLKSVPSNISSDIQQSSTVRNTPLEDTSADFLEAMLATTSNHEGIVLKTLTICNWDIKEVCFEYLLKMLSQSQLLMEVVFNGQCCFDSTNFALFIEHFLQSELKTVSLPGVIQDSLAFKISTMIKDNIPVSSDKILTISDSSISGSALAPLVSAIANQDTSDDRSPKVSLRVPIEYKYDFHGSRNVSFYGNVLLVDNPFIKFLS